MSRRTAALTSAAAAAVATTATPAPVDTVDDTLRAAYHDGPPEIGYFGAQWRRGVPQKITAAGWAGMRERADFAAFDFRLITPEPPADKE